MIMTLGIVFGITTVLCFSMWLLFLIFRKTPTWVLLGLFMSELLLLFHFT